MSELCETAEGHTYNVVTAQVKTLLCTRISSEAQSIIIKKNGGFSHAWGCISERCSLIIGILAQAP